MILRTDVSSIGKSKSASNFKTSPVGQRSKDAETGVPNFEEFKEAFNSTLVIFYLQRSSYIYL
jgi:hypothetical protein